MYPACRVGPACSAPRWTSRPGSAPGSSRIAVPQVGTPRRLRDPRDRTGHTPSQAPDLIRSRTRGRQPIHEIWFSLRGVGRRGAVARTAPPGRASPRPESAGTRCARTYARPWGLLGDVSSWPSCMSALNHQQPGMKGRTGITVGTFRTSGGWVDPDKPHLTRGSPSHQADTPATNVSVQVQQTAVAMTFSRG